MKPRTAIVAGTASLVAILLVLHAIHTHRPAPEYVFLEDMTWTEVRDAIAAGKTTAIVPTGGTEQNGPHLVLGKHHYVVRETSRRIAEELGDALVAPVIDYVPEGAVESSDGHMSFAGTITVPDKVFEDLLESTARSLKERATRMSVSHTLS